MPPTVPSRRVHRSREVRASAVSRNISHHFISHSASRNPFVHNRCARVPDSCTVVAPETCLRNRRRRKFAFRCDAVAMCAATHFFHSGPSTTSVALSNKPRRTDRRGVHRGWLDRHTRSRPELGAGLAQPVHHRFAAAAGLLPEQALLAPKVAPRCRLGPNVSIRPRSTSEVQRG